MKQDIKRISSSITISVLFVCLLFIVQFINWMRDYALDSFGIVPRELSGLKGILFFPLVHGSWGHLLSNTFPLLLLLSFLFYFFEKAAWKIFSLLYLGGGLLVWLAARPQSCHIGASGLIYALAAFLFVSGLLRRQAALFALSLVIAFLYGGMLWGVLPGEQGISWEGHLFGALTGIGSAYLFRKAGPQAVQPDWMHEKETDTGRNFSIADYIEQPSPED